MMRCKGIGAKRLAGPVVSLALIFTAAVPAQQPDASAVIRSIDAAVKARFDGLAGYSVTEHYAVYRGSYQTHPVAEMTVRTEYRKETGKSYTILSESGSGFIQTYVLQKLLDDEKTINLPGTREQSWITSANYEMQLKPGGAQLLDGRSCYALAIVPRRKATNLIAGTLWVDAKDGEIVRLEGDATESPSIFTGPAHVMREYASVNSFGMATQARAVSDSFLLGRTTVTIEYRDYQMQLAPAQGEK
jgi:outer membrane lipoprotein-sorting protein